MDSWSKEEYVITCEVCTACSGSGRGLLRHADSLRWIESACEICEGTGIREFWNKTMAEGGES